MIRIGLASSAFPAKSQREVLDLAIAAGFEGIEWAAEAHLPPGDRAAAQNLLMETLQSRLAVASYAALYRVSPGHENGLGFESILDTASALQSPAIRIFAGHTAFPREREEDKDRLIEELNRLGDLSAYRGISLCLSFGRGTSLETYDSARLLLDCLDHPFVGLAWEALPRVGAEEASLAIEEFTSRTNLILARKSDSLGRSCSLSDDRELWRRRVEAFRRGETEPKMSRFVLLGRIGGEDEPRLREDASFLKELVKEKNPPRI